MGKERKTEEQLAAQKAKAAREQAAAQKEKAQLEKQQQQLTAASTALEAVLLAIRAAAEVVHIASAGKFGVDNIALAIAGAATIAASIFTVKSAAQQFGDGTGALGADGVLRGPSHANGGIPFTVAGRPSFEAEGGETVTPVDATQKNGALLHLIRTEGRSRTLGPLDMLQLARRAQGVAASLKPTPSSHFESGGLLNKGGTPGGQASAADVGSLRAELQRNNALLEQLVANTANVASSTAATQAHTAQTAASNQQLVAFGPPVLEFGHEAELKRQRLVQGMNDAQDSATL